MSTEEHATEMHFTPIGPTSDRDLALAATPSRAEYQDFYTAYGECFSSWSGIEFNLLSIYIFSLNAPDYEAASAAFYSTTGFRAKLDMVNAVVTNSKRVDEDDLIVWKKVHENASQKSRRRNELAHNVVFFGRLSDLGERKMFVSDPRTPSKSSRLHTHDLFQVRQSFIALQQELFSFWERLLSKNGY